VQKLYNNCHGYINAQATGDRISVTETIITYKCTTLKQGVSNHWTG